MVSFTLRDCNPCLDLITKQIFMKRPESCVIFRHHNEDFVLQKEQIVLNRYNREFSGKKIVEIDTKCNHNNVKSFFEFLRTGDVPYLLEDQIQVFQLLKEWDCHFTVYDSFRFRIQSRSSNGFITHQNILYPLNVGLFFFYSSVFRDFCLNHPQEVFVIDHKYSTESIKVFLDLLHCRIQQPEIEIVGEVLELSRFLGCSSFYGLINESSPKSILSTILQKQEEEGFDFSFYENAIVHNLELYLSLEDFGKVCIPFLYKVFQKSQLVFTTSLLLPFFRHCSAFHGSNASVFLSTIKFQPANNLEDLSQLLMVFSKKNNSDFYSLFDHGFNQLSNMKGEICEKDLRIAILVKKQEEDQKRIDDLEISLVGLKKYIQTVDMKKRKEEENKNNGEENDKQLGEYEKIGKWKTIKAPDFVDNIFKAAAEGRLTSVIYHLANYEKRYQDTDYDDYRMQDATPLHFSSRYGHLSVVEYLVNHRANVESTDDKYKCF